MKIFLALIVFFSFHFAALGQSDTSTIIYVDSVGLPSNVKDHWFYTVIELDNLESDGYKTTKFSRNGSIVEKGWSKDKKYWQKNGLITTLFENGKIKKLENYKDGFYSGKVEEWYESGLKKLEGEAIKGDHFPPYGMHIYNYWTSDGKQTVVNGQGYYKKIEGDEILQGSIHKGYRDGKWTITKTNSNENWELIYKKKKFVRGKYQNEAGEKTSFTQLMKQPVPEGGIKAFYSLLSKNIRINNDTPNGKTMVQFVVELDGRISEFKSLKQVSPEIDKEIFRVLQLVPSWSPGLHMGKPMRVLFTLPVTIQKN